MRKTGFAVVALAGILSVFAPSKAAARDWDDDYGRHHERSERWRRHEAHEWREHERRDNAWRRQQRREHQWRERQRGAYYYSPNNGYYQHQGGDYDSYGNYQAYDTPRD